MDTLPVLNPSPVNREAIVTATNLVKVYGAGDANVRAVDGVTAEFSAGTFTAIMGASGSGKSTFMHCLAGLDRPTSGRVRLVDACLETLDDDELTAVRRDKVGFIFQSFNLLPTHTAAENILLPVELAGRKVDQGLFDFLVSSLGLAGRLKHLPSQMSGGEQQRVAVARAFITRPAVVFADEPSGALDSRNSTHLLEYLRQASATHGQTIIMVTHDPHAASYADRVLTLADGRITTDTADQSAPDTVRDHGGSQC